MTYASAINLPTRRLFMLGFAALLALAMWALLPGFSPSWPGDGNASLPASLRVDGTVEATTSQGSVSRLVVPLAVRGDAPMLLTEDGRLHASTFMSESAAAAVPSTYTLEWLDGNGDEFLDPGEHAVLTVDLPVPSPVRAENELEIIIRPVVGAPLVIEDVLP